MKARALGAEGEKLAASHLVKAGYRIVERNYRCPLGEIDCVAVKNHVLVFLEVKARRSLDFGGPLEAVDYRKRKKLTRLARYYVAEKGVPPDMARRFDVVGVWLSANDNPQVEIFENAFEAVD